MAWYSDPLIDKAVELYFRAHKRAGTPDAAIMQPSRHESVLEGDVIELRSGSEILARFKIRTDGKRLRRLEAVARPVGSAAASTSK